VTADQPIDLELTVLGDALRLLGGGSLRMSAHRIEPVTALAGAIRLRDDVAVSFDLVATEEEEP
jgi:hypothetical protein